MILLLDLNALIALAHTAHTHHAAAVRWVSQLPAADRIATCSITQIGFVRVTVQAKLQPDVATAKVALARLLASLKHTQLNDDLSVSALPAFVKGPQQVTDGHLLSLARRHGAELATFDTAIPGATAI